MKTILQINSSARSNGNANALADQFVGEWLTTHAQDKLVKRDVGANPLPIIVPCHRVIAQDDTIGGFSSGLPAKRRLLALEGSVSRLRASGRPG